MASMNEKVDHAALRINQAAIITLLAMGFVLDFRTVVPAVGLIMALGSLLRKPGFLPIYRILRRLQWVKPDLRPDRMQPHRFAQSLGAVVLVAGTSLSLLPGPWIWTSAWLVIALAGLNLFGGYCVGCSLYYWLHRIGMPGFSQGPPAGAPSREP